MAVENIRIVDFEGKIAATGRVEVRSMGVWGTLCVVGTENSVARTICKQLKFLDG